jgi:hypothetical protein
MKAHLIPAEPPKIHVRMAGPIHAAGVAWLGKSWAKWETDGLWESQSAEAGGGELLSGFTGNGGEYLGMHGTLCLQFLALANFCR